MTGAVAAMAEPPQMEDPTPMRVEVLPGRRRTFCSRKATTSEVVMVDTMTGRLWAPTRAISDRFSPKPSRMTAYCKIFLDV